MLELRVQGLLEVVERGEALEVGGHPSVVDVGAGGAVLAGDRLDGELDVGVGDGGDGHGDGDRVVAGERVVVAVADLERRRLVDLDGHGSSSSDVRGAARPRVPVFCNDKDFTPDGARRGGEALLRRPCTAWRPLG